jgi:hypothetical protein
MADPMSHGADAVLNLNAVGDRGQIEFDFDQYQTQLAALASSSVGFERDRCMVLLTCAEHYVTWLRRNGLAAQVVYDPECWQQIKRLGLTDWVLVEFGHREEQ